MSQEQSSEYAGGEIESPDSSLSKKGKVAVFIDGQNLLGFFNSRSLEIDFSCFRMFLDSRFAPDDVFFHCINFSDVGVDRGSFLKRNNWHRFFTALSRSGFTVRPKRAVEVQNGDAVKIKGNQDVEIVTDCLTYAWHHQASHIILVTEDCDFAYLLRTLSGPPFYIQTTLLAPDRSLAVLRAAASDVVSLDDVHSQFSRRRSI